MKKRRAQKVLKKVADFFLSLKKSFGSDTLEAQHRISWRRYAAVFILMPAVSLALALTSYADTKSSASQSLGSQLVSQEGEIKTIGYKKPAAVAKKKVKAEAPDKFKKKVLKTVAGTVSGVTTRSLSVETGSTEETGTQEMLISLGKGVALKNLKAASELKYGDVVKVEYEQVYRENEIDPALDPTYLSASAKTITLVRKGKPLPLKEPCCDDEA